MLTKAIRRFLNLLNIALVAVAGGVLFGPQVAATAMAASPNTDPKPHTDSNPVLASIDYQPDAEPGSATDVPPTTDSVPTTTQSIPVIRHALPTPSHPTTAVLVDDELTTPKATINTPSPTPVYTSSHEAAAPTNVHHVKVHLPPGEKPASEHKSKPIQTPAPAPRSTHTSTPAPVKPTHKPSPTPTPTKTIPKTEPKVVLATDITTLTASQIRAAKVAAIIKFARAQLGEPYASPGNSYSTWDCSGLTQKAFGVGGIYIGTHSATNQFSTGKSKGYLVPYSEKKPGDQIFYGTPGNMYHTTLYTGKRLINGINVPYMIEAADWGKPVRERNVWGTPYQYVVRWVR